jgi:hypothetical protein
MVATYTTESTRMFQYLITSGDSFSSGFGLKNTFDSWPYLLAKKLNVKVENLAVEGMGNEHIINSIMQKDLSNSFVICGFTQPSRIEFLDNKTGKKFTTIPNRRGQTHFENIFWHDFYDEVYYYEKFITDVKLFSTYLKHNKTPYLFFDVMPINHYCQNFDNNYIWFNSENMCSITYPHKLADGHPNETAHEIMAQKLYNIIKR